MADDIELAEGVWQAAIDAWDEVRYADHPDNQQAKYGVSTYAVKAMLAAAYAAGQRSVTEGGTTEVSHD